MQIVYNGGSTNVALLHAGARPVGAGGGQPRRCSCVAPALLACSCSTSVATVGWLAGWYRRVCPSRQPTSYYGNKTSGQPRCSLMCSRSCARQQCTAHHCLPHVSRVAGYPCRPARSETSCSWLVQMPDTGPMPPRQPAGGGGCLETAE